MNGTRRASVHVARAAAMAAAAALLWAIGGCAGGSDAPSTSGDGRIVETGLPASESARLHVGVAQGFEETGQWREAIRHYERARALAPNTFAWVCRRLGRLYAIIGEPGRAGVEYGRALRLDPNDASLLDEAGRFELSRGRPAEAEAHFRRAGAIEPGRTELWTHLGLALGAQAEYERAFEAFARAMPPAEARANVALAMGRNGEFERATEQMRLAIRGRPELQRYNGVLEAMRTERTITDADTW